jgi:8-oxo-dGTP diphosphatase
VIKSIHVVGAVIVRDGLVLCAQRGPTGALGGMWEFPGGKVEDNEGPAAALAREIREELLCDIAVGSPVTSTRHEYPFAAITLDTYWCELLAGQPVATEHAELRWVAANSLHELDWAPADLPAVELVAERLGVRAD